MKRWPAFLLLIGLSACLPQESGKIHGYMEGEFVMIAPTSGGILKEISVKRGDTVNAGTDLFSLDLAVLETSKNAAKANLDHALAQLDDLTKGARPEEIEVLRRQKEQAIANLSYASKEYERTKLLVTQDVKSKSSLDQAKSAYDAATEQVKELEARLSLSALGSRSDQISAAQATVELARQNLAQTEKILSEAAPKSPVTGYVDDTFYRPGEFVAAGQPVISLLPPENIKARFFVPQSLLPKLRRGQGIVINCDGCSAPIQARITFIAPNAEFTPPVIYSVESRDKLVFMVEAAPDVPNSDLHPGLPVDISLEPLRDE